MPSLGNLPGALVGAAEQAAGSLLNTVEQNIGNVQTILTSLLSPQMTAQLAPSVFAAGPNDALVTADIYGVTTTSPINAVNQLQGSNNANVIASFQASIGSINGLSGLISASAAGVSLNSSVLASRVASAVTGFSGAYSNIPNSIAGQAVQQAVVAANQYPTINTTVNGVVSTVNTTNLQSAQDLITAINQITGNPAMASYMDNNAASALLSVVIREAISLGISGVIEALVSTATNDEVAQTALQQNTAYAVQMADLDAINTIVTALGSGYVSSQVPNASGQILAAYQIPAGSTAANYASLYTALTNTLNAVDPNWGSGSRNGQTVSDLTPFANVSPGAQTLFNSQGQYQTELAIASTYPSVGLVSQAQAQYPYMLITPTTSQYVVTNPQSNVNAGEAISVINPDGSITTGPTAPNGGYTDSFFPSLQLG
jgi:hypothetical protein